MSPPATRLSSPRVRARLRSAWVALALFAAYAAAIVALTWPWLATADSCVFAHWDPPFHAWKLAYAARALLAGHLLPPNGDTNVLYPQSGAFFFEALHWLQAVFAAPLLALGLSATLVYHVTLVFFWALSGVTFRYWLRSLSLRDPPAALGGLFFVLLPYRVSYAVEFNMQLCFALPLLFGAIVRFFRRPSLPPALLAALAWWLQATSELYQAVFVVVVLPLFLVPLFARDPALLASFRRFWVPFLVAAAACALLSWPFLAPYLRTLADGTLVRSAGEMRTHGLEPFSYALPYSRIHLFPVPRARHDEMSVYPTVALALAAVWAFVSTRRAPRLVNRLFRAALVLAAVAALCLHVAPEPVAAPMASATAWLLIAAVILSIPCLLRPDRSLPRAAAAGLGAAAILGLVLSFGPDLRDSAGQVAVSNPLFSFFSPVLSGFRVISRFAVFPTLALCTAAATGLHRAAHTPALQRASRPLRAGLLALFLAAFVLECIPPSPRLRPVRDVSASAALAAYDALPDPKVLAIVPMGDRSLDSEHMLTIARHDRLSAWAWAGTFPGFSKRLRDALDSSLGNPDLAVTLLRTLWPTPCVLEDLRPFGRRSSPDYAAFFGNRAELVAADPDFRLWRLAPDPSPVTEAVRLVRRDLAAALPVALFSLSAPSPCRVWLDVNGVPLAAFDATPSPADHAVPVPAALLLPRLPQRYRFHADADAPFVLSGFRLAPADALPPLPDPSSAPALPWLEISDTLPAGAIPLDVRYPRGITLCGATPADWHPAVPPETLPTLRFRLYFRLPATQTTPPNIVLSPGYSLDGAILYKNPTPFRCAVDSASFPFARGRIVAADLSLPVLSHLPEGAVYTLSLDIVTPPPFSRHLGPRHLFLPVSLPIRHPAP